MTRSVPKKPRVTLGVLLFCATLLSGCGQVSLLEWIGIDAERIMDRDGPVARQDLEEDEFACWSDSGVPGRMVFGYLEGPDAIHPTWQVALDISDLDMHDNQPSMTLRIERQVPGEPGQDPQVQPLFVESLPIEEGGEFRRPNFGAHVVGRTYYANAFSDDCQGLALDFRGDRDLMECSSVVWIRTACALDQIACAIEEIEIGVWARGYERDPDDPHRRRDTYYENQVHIVVDATPDPLGDGALAGPPPPMLLQMGDPFAPRGGFRVKSFEGFGAYNACGLPVAWGNWNIGDRETMQMERAGDAMGVVSFEEPFLPL